jgi:hypothetical protein
MIKGVPRCLVAGITAVCVTALLGSGLCRAESPPRLAEAGLRLALQVEDEPSPILPTHPVTPARVQQPPEEVPAYKTWWFWALTVGVVASAVTWGVVASRPTAQPPAPCSPGVIACFGDGRSQ